MGIIIPVIIDLDGEGIPSLILVPIRLKGVVGVIVGVIFAGVHGNFRHTAGGKAQTHGINIAAVICTGLGAIVVLSDQAFVVRSRQSSQEVQSVHFLNTADGSSIAGLKPVAVIIAVGSTQAGCAVRHHHQERHTGNDLAIRQSNGGIFHTCQNITAHGNTGMNIGTLTGTRTPSGIGALSTDVATLVRFLTLVIYRIDMLVNRIIMAQLGQNGSRLARCTALTAGTGERNHRHAVIIVGSQQRFNSSISRTDRCSDSVIGSHRVGRIQNEDNINRNTHLTG